MVKYHNRTVTVKFYPRDALHNLKPWSFLLSQIVRPFICPSHAGIVSKWLNLS